MIINMCKLLLLRVVLLVYYSRVHCTWYSELHLTDVSAYVSNEHDFRVVYACVTLIV